MVRKSSGGDDRIGSDVSEIKKIDFHGSGGCLLDHHGHHQEERCKGGHFLLKWFAGWLCSGSFVLFCWANSNPVTTKWEDWLSFLANIHDLFEKFHQANVAPVYRDKVVPGVHVSRNDDVTNGVSERSEVFEYSLSW